MASFFGKTYKLEKNENFSELLHHFGIPDEQIEYLLKSKPTLKFDKDGSNYVFTVVDEKTTVLKFQEGVEFEEPLTEEIIAKTTITIGDDENTQVQKFADGHIVTIKRKFSGNQLVEEISPSNWDSTARRVFTEV